MTYRDLLNALDKLTDEQLDCDLSVYVPGIDEYYEAQFDFSSEEGDVLDEGHPIFVII